MNKLKFNDFKKNWKHIFFNLQNRFPLWGKVGQLSERKGECFVGLSILLVCGRYGHLSEEIFRACRLVVDTGMHALGWTKDQAVQYMADHTAASLENIRGEVSHQPSTWYRESFFL